MFIAERFSYDPIWVQSLQSELYWSLISIPFEISKDLYERSEWILGVFTTLGKDCKTIQTIDHRVFESLHDAIAAKFRFENRNDFELNYPEIPKHRLDTDNIKLRWINYFRSQIETLFEKTPTCPARSWWPLPIRTLIRRELSRNAISNPSARTFSCLSGKANQQKSDT